MYGEVEYYFAHEYIHENVNQVRMFAYIRKINHNTDNYRQIYFKYFSSYQFFEVIGIDRCVGFFNISNNKYILDKERM